MSALQQGFICVCGNTYPTERGLKQHQRRHCRGADRERSNTCPQCEREFTTYAGMRQHLKQAHKEEYNRELEAESANARTAWTNEEEGELARCEAELDPSLTAGAILDHLMSVSARTRDALKGRRRQQSYIQKVREFREQAATTSAGRDEEDGSPDLSAELAAQAGLEANEELKAILSSLNEEQLTAEDKEFRDILLNQPQEIALNALENWCASLLGGYLRPRRNRDTNRVHPRTKLVDEINQPGLGRRRLRAKLYKLSQMDYKNDQQAYANKLLDGIPLTGSNTMPNEEDLKSQYRAIFETQSPADMEEVVDRCPEVTRISTAITVEDIDTAIRTSKNGSPGPDGITLKDFSKINKQRLVLLFNAMLLLEAIPRMLKTSRTTLIPKSTEGLEEVKNWRPITVSSIVLRTFNKIIANRLLNKLHLHGSQRGFTKIDGCFANAMILETLIKTHRKKGRPFSIISLDLAKAFDTLSHHSIKRAFKRFNIDDKTINLVVDNYTDSSTELHCIKKKLGIFNIRIGVKQGDPLSPIIFSMVIDELLVLLDKKEGISVGGDDKISSMAYADDINICAEDPNDAGRMLKLATDFFTRRGLRLNADKCISLVTKCVPSKKKLYIETEPRYTVDDVTIPAITIGQEMRYLGMKFSSDGLTKCESDNLLEQLTTIKRAPLKPQQKLNIIKTYLIPRYIASLQRPNVSRKLLRNVDKKIRAAVKSILHLHSHCHNSLFYTPLKFGGLGIFNFQHNIPIITRNRILKLRESSHLLNTIIGMAEDYVARLGRQVDPDATTARDVKEKFSAELHASFVGKGLHQVKEHRACSRYITDPPKYWNGEDYIRAIQLRFNLLPCMGLPSIPPEQRRCRAGCHKMESLSHILQGCSATHWQRVQRHDYVCKRLQDAARRRGWNITKEPHIRSADGVLKKPDIMFAKDDKLIVTDVGVNWEGDIPLNTQYENKVAIYSTAPFIEKLKALFPNHNIFILPLIIGARGTWGSRNRPLIQQLQLSDNEIADCVHTVLRGGWMTHRYFMRVVWRERRTQRRRPT